eukprot:10205650-Ditylum_brightwellii.AAC.1
MLKPNLKPFCAHAYTIPMAIEHIAREEIKNFAISTYLAKVPTHRGVPHAYFKLRKMEAYASSPIYEN